MRFFHKRKKAPRRKVSTEEKIKRLELQDRKRAREILFDMIEHNEGLKKAFVAKEMDLDPDIFDPEKIQKGRLLEVVNDRAVDILKDPKDDLGKRLAREHLQKITGIEITNDEKGLDGRGQSPLADIITNVREARELLRELGIEAGGGGLRGTMAEIMNSRVVVEFVKLLPALLGKDAGRQPPGQALQGERIVIVKVDGQLAEMTESEYLALEDSGKAPPVAEMQEIVDTYPGKVNPDGLTADDRSEGESQAIDAPEEGNGSEDNGDSASSEEATGGSTNG